MDLPLDNKRKGTIRGMTFIMVEQVAADLIKYDAL